MKSRIKAWAGENEFNTTDTTFLNEKTPFDVSDLQHVLTNNFSRITLVSNTDKERLTIDFHLQFAKDDNVKQLSNLVIAEVKQENVNILRYKYIKSNKNI